MRAFALAVSKWVAAPATRLAVPMPPSSRTPSAVGFEKAKDPDIARDVNAASITRKSLTAVSSPIAPFAPVGGPPSGGLNWIGITKFVVEYACPIHRISLGFSPPHFR